MTMSYSPYLIIPGWGGSGPDHWQSFWARDLHAKRVELTNWFAQSRETWVDAIESALAALAQRDARPPVLVAHSLGCIALAHWARQSRRTIRAALLVAPADVEHPPCEQRLSAFGPIPLAPLPFPSLVVASDDDPHAELPRVRGFAAAWVSELHVVRAGGHLNATSGLGRWRLGRALLASLLHRTELALTA